MPACIQRGTYTIQMKGANHTDSTCQLHIESTTSLCANNHPSPRNICVEKLTNRQIKRVEHEVRIRGIVISTVKVAASEKLRTVTMEITVEARHKLAASKMAEVGAVSSDVCRGTAMDNSGNRANKPKTIGEST